MAALWLPDWQNRLGPERARYHGSVTKAAEDILHDAMALPLGQRAELAVEILASLDGAPDEAVEAAWAAEIATRVERIRRGDAKGRRWEDVRADLEHRTR